MNLPTNNVILPPQTIGIIGGGQLGRMMALAARHMGYQIAVLDPTLNCPTAQVADMQITAQYDDLDAIQRLIEASDVITYEFENVDLEAAALIEKSGKLPQGALALEITQNREKEKALFQKLSLPIPAFEIVHTAEECEEVLKAFPLPAVMKTCRGGYDGKGQVKLDTEADFAEAKVLVDAASPCIIEQWIPFEKEISTVFTRSVDGKVEFFPIGENDHREQILYQTTVPAKITDKVKEKAYAAATRLAERMEIVGTFTVEMFVKGDEVYLNEMAPRPHNSGHYTIEACNISQFAQHVRAICGLELTPVTLFEPSVMVNILGEDLPGTLQAIPQMTKAFVHLYGKDEAKPKRKMGHVTFVAPTVEKVRKLVEAYHEKSK